MRITVVSSRRFSRHQCKVQGNQYQGKHHKVKWQQRKQYQRQGKQYHGLYHFVAQHQVLQH